MKRAKEGFCQNMIKLIIGKAVSRSEAKKTRLTKARHKMCHTMVVYAENMAVARSEGKRVELEKIENDPIKTSKSSKMSCRKRKFDEQEVKSDDSRKKKMRYKTSEEVARSPVELSVARTGGQECEQNSLNVIFDQSPPSETQNKKEIGPGGFACATKVKIKIKRKFNVKKDETKFKPYKKTKITQYFQTIHQLKATTNKGGQIKDKTNHSENIHERQGMPMGELEMGGRNIAWAGKGLGNRLGNSHFQLEYDHHVGPDRSGEHPSS